MKATIKTLSLWLTGEIESMNRTLVQITCTNVGTNEMNELYRNKASVFRLPSGKLSIIIDREDILSIEFLDKED